MIDRYLVGPIRVALTPPARFLAWCCVSANSVTLAGFAIGLLALPALALGHYGWALALILMNRLADGLDGVLARLTRPTDRGAFLDIALDFFFYATVPAGFALADPARNALPAAVLLLAFIGTTTSFLAFASVAARRGMVAKAFPRKGIYYLGGLTEGAETLAVFAAMCLWPGAFPVLAWAYAAACFVTTAMRWHMGWTIFGEETGAAQPADDPAIREDRATE